MRRNHLLPSILLLGVLAASVLPGQATVDSVVQRSLRTEFAQPGEQHRPETWFHLIGGNVSKEGLSVDLAAVKAAGLRGIQLFHGRGREWPGVSPQIQTLSPKWDDLIGHVGRETERLDLDFTMQNCPGWAMSGGPWITPEVAMRHLIWSRRDIAGGTDFAGQLPLPQPSEEDWRDYRDVAVLAFPTPAGDTGTLLQPAQVSSNRPDQPWTQLLAGEETSVALAAGDTLTYVEVSFPEPTLLRSISIPPVEILMKRRNFDPGSYVTVEAYVGEEWALVGKQTIPRGNWQDRLPEMPLVLAFSDFPARRFRINFHHRFPMQLDYLRLSSAARTHDWRGQAGFALRSREGKEDLRQDPDAWVSPASVLDLTNRTTPDGHLNWMAPPGKWTVVRFGHVNTGVKNKPAPPEATGFECDKLSPLGAERHFAGYIGRLTEPGGPVAGQLEGMLIDSWECYTQTWTPAMEREFTARRGYELRQWLPALAGWIVADPPTSERFLRDWRATISDLLVENYFGRMAELGRERGLKLSFETALGDVSPGDILQYFGAADVPMCEFWQPNDPHWGGFETKPIHPAVSAAHIYDKPVIAAEAFTNVGIQWNEHPFILKHRADQHFALGVNHLIFHTYTHNPRLDLVPGTSFGNRIGTPFLRGQTWWPYMSEFTDYLARCAALLQVGRPVVDVLWYLGDAVDHKPRQDHPFPEGYKFDYLNHDALLRHITVEDGELRTPGGNRWRVLWLPETTATQLTVPTLRKLKALLENGATVIGPPPTANPSLSGGAAARQAFHRLVEEIWGGDPGDSGKRRHGNGLLLWGDPLKASLGNLGIPPDVPGLRSAGWYHRRTAAQDIYFLSADRVTPLRGHVRFRAMGTPSLWNPLTGTTQPVPVFRRAGAYVSVPIDLPAAGSVFVVFDRETSVPSWNQVTLDGEPLYGPGDTTVMVDSGKAYPFAGLTPTDTLQPWVTPAAPQAAWLAGNDSFLAFANGEYGFSNSTEFPTIRQAKGARRQSLDAGWQLTFPAGWDAVEKIDLPRLTSWTDLARAENRAFSGTATYRKTVTLAETPEDSRFLLDLGRVANLATVRVNGRLAATLWAPPFRVDVTDYLRSGANELEIAVTNTWRNRLIHDARLPAAKRKTWTIHAPPQDAPLEPAGLLGPVVLYEGKVISLSPD